MQKTNSYLDYFLHGVYFTTYGLVKYIPSPIGDVLRYWFTKPFIKKMGRVRISEGVTIGYPYRVEIGDYVTLNNGVTIDGYGGVKIGSYVRIAHRASIMSSDHNYSDRDIPVFKQGLTFSEVTIGDDCWLGCNVVILPGVVLQKGSIIAANAVVNKSCDEYSVLGGIPAKKLKSRGDVILKE